MVIVGTHCCNNCGRSLLDHIAAQQCDPRTLLAHIVVQQWESILFLEQNVATVGTEVMVGLFLWSFNKVTPIGNNTEIIQYMT